MTHYNVDDWAEFALGGAPVERRRELQAHLDAGCEECARHASMWTRLREMAGREKTFQPPESAVRFARTLYRVFTPEESAVHPVIEWCRMIFDSRLQPALAGVRGGMPAPDRFLFQGGRLILDVVMEPRSDDQPVSLIGQISEPANPAGKLDRLDVSVVPDDGPVARTTTNAAGEFQMIFKAAKEQLLVVKLPNHSVLVSPLPAPVSKRHYC